MTKRADWAYRSGRVPGICQGIYILNGNVTSGGHYQETQT